MPHATYPNTKKGNQSLVFGHSLLHRYWRLSKKSHGSMPKNWPPNKIISWHAAHVKMLLARGFKHNSPLR